MTDVVAQVRTPAECHAARACPTLSGMTWAQRLKRVFKTDIETCGRCGGSVKVIACFEDQDVIPDKAGQALDRFLAHLREKEQDIPTLPLLLPRASHHLPGHHLRHCLFSQGRARSGRFQLNCIQSAGTPLKNSLVYSPERRTGSCQVSKVSERDLQDQQCEY